ncbi:MAG: phosphoenolpyruvate carboxykinase (ATP) [Acidobacteriota bacterium]
MENRGPHVSRHGLETVGIHRARTVWWNLSPARLYEQALARGEAELAHSGPLVAETGAHTGRSPRDKFTVRDERTGDRVWWGEVNQPISPEHYGRLLEKVRDYAADVDLFVFDGYAGAHPEHRLRVRIVTQYAWHSLFARNMFVREHDGGILRDFEPEFTVVDLPGLKADPETDGTNSPTFIVVSFAERMALLGGTEYAGEIKKSIFSVMNYALPEEGVLSMHCSANYGRDRNDAALFFGLSGTGKTTLSADAERTLIGDDEHGWADDGVFNIEGGCYAKVIRLDPEHEPQIFATTRRFGTILENVVYDSQTRVLNLDDESKTENTRASYPIDQLDNVDLTGRCGHPKNVLFLAADAFGVLPPIARLTPEQAMYHFLSGYTAKVAGTERGVTEPKATFSACFGAPFLPLHPGVYAEMLGERLERHGSKVWLVNTGWTGGPYGTGHRIAIGHTRRIVRAALSGELDRVETRVDPIFGLAVPVRVDGVPDALLTPRKTWSDPEEYDRQAGRLARMFRDNFARYSDQVSEAVRAAGP